MGGMIFAGLCGTVAALCLGVILTRGWHGRWSSDFERSGPQKHHHGAPPRVGGIPLCIGLVLGALALHQSPNPAAAQAGAMMAVLLVCALPVWLLGLADDLTKRVRPRVRMAGATTSAALAAAVAGTLVQRTGLPPLDALLTASPWGVALLSVPVTLLLVAGFTNAMNIVDGLNGLAGGITLVMLAGTAAVAALVQDAAIMHLCLLLAACVAGFLLVNFPRGHIFLGDGGAYLIGFLMVQVWIALVNRNPGVAPLAIVALAFWPTMETVFSIYRRRYRGRVTGTALADRLHLHSLLYRRRMLPWLKARLPYAPRWVANAMGAATLVAAAALPVALCAWLGAESTAASLAIVFVAASGYVAWFNRLAIKGPRVARRPAGWRADPLPQQVVPLRTAPARATESNLPEPWADAA